MSEVTDLLRDLGGDDAAGDERLPELVYEELRGVARRLMRGERPGHTLQATALVHEAWIRLADRGLAPDDRARFLGAAAEAMRRLLVDHARARARGKRDPGRARVSLDAAAGAEVDEDPAGFLALDEAIRRLSSLDPRMGRVVRLRYFAGLSIEQTAQVLETSPRTVKREWALARAWLFRELGSPDGGDGRRG